MAAPKPPPLNIEEEQEAALIKKYGMKPKLSPRLLAKVGGAGLSADIFSLPSRIDKTHEAWMRAVALHMHRSVQLLAYLLLSPVRMTSQASACRASLRS